MTLAEFFFASQIRKAKMMRNRLETDPKHCYKEYKPVASSAFSMVFLSSLEAAKVFTTALAANFLSSLINNHSQQG